ncbi:MAG: type I methionyl aminopeptidase [bacterium]
MITIKSPREIELMRKAGRIVALAHAEVAKNIRPGISTLELDEIVEKVIRDNDAIPSFKGYNGFPGSICASINEVVVHGIPSSKSILKNGDIIAVDIGANYKGYHGDSAWTYAVGTISKEDQELMKVTKEALYQGLNAVKATVHLSDISNSIGTYATSFGYGVVEEFTGHGIGSQLHEDPAIPNFGKPHLGPVLKAGMTLAIEPMINIGTKRVKVLQDNWTTITCDKKNSAHYEHTILVTEDGYEILTTL